MRIPRRILSLALAAIMMFSLFQLSATAAGSEYDMHVRALIDGQSILCYQDGYVWWEHYEFDRPGEEYDYIQIDEDDEGNPIYEWVLVQKPVFIDDEEWIPQWHREYSEFVGRDIDVSDRLHVGQKFEFLRELHIMQARESLGIVSPGGGGEPLRIEFSDLSAGGSDWYECRIEFAQWSEPNVQVLFVDPMEGGFLRYGQYISMELQGLNVQVHDAYLVCQGNYLERVYFEHLDNYQMRMYVEFDPLLEYEYFVEERPISLELHVNTSYGTFFKQFNLYPTDEMTEVLNISRTIAAGDAHVLAILEDDSLWAWGRNDYGQLGDGTTISRSSPVKIMDGVLSVAAGANHSVALKKDGSVWTWGSNSNGQLGNGTGSSSSIPVKVWEYAVAVFAGYNTSAAIVPPVPTLAAASSYDPFASSGDLLVWGVTPGVGWYNEYPLNRMGGVTAAAIGQDFLIALRFDGSVWGQGVNNRGQLGNGKTRDTNYDESFFIMSDAIAIAAGQEHAAAMAANGTLYAWGSNERGQIADDWQLLNSKPVLRPYKVLENAAWLAAGESTTYAVMKDGALVGWGSSDYRQLNTSEYDDNGRAVINEDAVFAAAGTSSVLALAADGTLTVIGGNQHGQYGAGRSEVFPARTSLEGAAGVGAGMYHSMAVKTDGSLWTWGFNSYGQLGNGTRSNKSQPVQVLENVEAAAGGLYHSVALKADGSVWTWGYNYDGQLGNGESGGDMYRLAPEKVFEGATAVAASYNSTYAIAEDGTLYAWGYNYQGQLGNGTTANSAVPVEVMRDVAQVIAWGDHAYAIKTDNSLWGWGQNTSYQLGVGTNDNKLSPVKILDNVSKAASGYYHGLALLIDGTLWAWGRNFNGQLGNGQGAWNNFAQTPVQVMDGVSDVNANGSFSLALKENGDLYAFGDNYRGQLGDGTVVSRNLPVKVLSDVQTAAAGDTHVIALRTDGSLWSWGSNDYGQAGFLSGASQPELSPAVKLPEELNVYDDIYPPYVAYISPSDGTFNGTVTVSAEVYDDTTLSRVELQTSVDGGASWQPYLSQDTPRSYAYTAFFTLQTVDFPDGELRVRVLAYDTNDNESDGIPVAVYNIDNTAPAVPSGFTVETALDSIVIRWEKNTEADFYGYDVYRSAGDDSEPVRLAFNQQSASYSDRDVQERITYTYTVLARDRLGNTSAFSEPVLAQTLPDEEAPVVAGIQPATNSWMTGTMTVRVTAQDNFRLGRVELQTSTDGGDTWTAYASKDAAKGTYQVLDFEVDSTSFADGPLHVRALAYDTWGNASDGYPIRLYNVDNTPPAKVEGLRFESTTTAITLNWSDVPDNDFSYFRLELKAAGGGFEHLANINDRLGYVHGSLNPEDAFTYRVAAVDRAGNTGQWSDELAASTLADIYPPVITAIRPGPARFASSIPLSITARDDHKIAKIDIQVSRDSKDWTTIAELGEFTPSDTVVIDYALDISEITEGSLFVRAVAQDITGNRSASDDTAPFTEYVVDRTAPAAPSGITIEASIGHINVRWNQNAEQDLAGYNVYRSEDSGEFAEVASGLRALNYIDSNLREGATYSYKLTAFDSAGNMSPFSETVSAVAPRDEIAPEILSVSPASGSVLGKAAKLSVLASDNNRLARLTAEYRVAGSDTWTQAAEQAVNAPSYHWTFTLDTEAIGERAVEVRARAYDASGNESVYKSVSYSIDLTPPQAPQVTVEPGPMSINVNWTAANESDLAGFRIYRKTPSQKSYGLIAQIPPGQAAYTYTDKGVDVALTYSYRVEAVDACANSSYTDSGYFAPMNTDAEPPVARIFAPTMSEISAAVLFDGSASTDNIGVHSYLWDFGDGTTSSLAKPTHAYSERGTYRVTLTVADFAGHTDIAETEITIYGSEDLGTARIKVMDEAGMPIPGARIYLNLGLGEPEILTANQNGELEIKRTPGAYPIGVYVENYLPAKREVILEAGKTQDVRFNLVFSELILGDLTFHRMTLEEIIAAGIDIYAPENQNVFKFEIVLTYAEQTITMPIVVNGGGEILSGGEPFTFEDYSGNGGSRTFTPVVVPTSDPEKPLVVIINLPGQASWLKDFFDVNLHLINKADPEFSLVDCEATLNIPEGLTLMENTTASGTANVHIGTIKGQETKDIRWILRGDADGSYELSADFRGILADFNEEISAKFVAANPLVVEAAQGLSLEILVQDRIVSGKDGWIKLGLKNGAEREIYMPNLSLDRGTLVARYKTADGAVVETPMNTLFPGETLWVEYMFDTGLDVPNVELYLYSAVLNAVGGNVTLPYTFSVVKSLPAISSVGLPVSNFVAGCAANVRLDISGGNLSGAPLFIKFINRDGKVVYTGSATGSGDSFSEIISFSAVTMMPAGTYTALVETSDGSSSQAAAFTVEPLPTNIWSIDLLRLEEGKLIAAFHGEIAGKNGKFDVTVNGLAKTYVKDGNTLIISHEPVSGDAVRISGVMLPRLFPSYSFTYSAVYP